MQAVVIHQTGDPDVLRHEETDRPEPGDGEVLIRVHAASVNPADWKSRRGFREAPLPRVLGIDISGTVETSRAGGVAEGDQVFGFSASGGYAEYSTASATAIAKKPDGLSHEEAAAIPVAGLTAWQALFDRGGLGRRQTAVVAGAAGGVGHIAVQFAKVAGARAIGTGSTRNRDFVLGLGADEYVDYTQQDVGEAVSQTNAHSRDVLLGPGAQSARQYPAPGGGTGTEVYIKPGDFRRIFAADLSPARTRVLAASRRPIDVKAFSEPVTNATWHTLRSWCLVPEQDRAIGSDAELAMARRAHCHTQKIPGSHLVMVAKPDFTARFIEAAVRATT